VTRTDIRRSDAFGIWTLRPGKLGLREIETFAGGAWITRTTGEEQDGEAFAGGGIQFESGDRFSAFATRGFTQLDEAFDLSDRVPVPVGRYDLRRLTVFANSSHSRPVGLSLVGSFAREWDGRVSSLETGLRIAGGAHLEASPTWTVSHAVLPGGSFKAHVLGLRLGWAFSTRLFARAYVQYNGLEDKWITNLRLNFIHRPGSDIFVVVNDDQGEEGAPGRLVSRGFAVKGTWLIRF
jgi:hypothetical protein